MIEQREASDVCVWLSVHITGGCHTRLGLQRGLFNEVKEEVGWEARLGSWRAARTGPAASLLAFRCRPGAELWLLDLALPLSGCENWGVPCHRLHPFCHALLRAHHVPLLTLAGATENQPGTASILLELPVQQERHTHCQCGEIKGAGGLQ